MFCKLSRWEFDCADAQLKLMREAGISAFRTDFDWGAVEKEKGKFNYSKWDSLVAKAQSAGVEVLTIIPGATPKFAHFAQRSKFLE